MCKSACVQPQKSDASIKGLYRSGINLECSVLRESGHVAEPLLTVRWCGRANVEGLKSLLVLLGGAVSGDALCSAQSNNGSARG